MSRGLLVVVLVATSICAQFEHANAFGSFSQALDDLSSVVQAVKSDNSSATVADALGIDVDDLLKKAVEAGLTEAVHAIMPAEWKLATGGSFNESKFGATVAVQYGAPTLSHLKDTSVLIDTLVMDYKNHTGAANFTIVAHGLEVSANATGSACFGHYCRNASDFEAHVTFADVNVSTAGTFAFALLPLPHLSAVPCIGPVKDVIIGPPSVNFTGDLGPLAPYAQELVEAMIAHDGVARNASVSLLNMLMKAAEKSDPHCTWAHGPAADKKAATPANPAVQALEEAGEGELESLLMQSLVNAALSVPQ